MSVSVDLSQLAVDRSAPPPERKRRRALLSRVVLPVVLLLGFGSLAGWAARDRFVGRKPVRVVPVVVSRAEFRQAGTHLFQAAGWVEPRPRPVLVTALAEGVIEDVFVVEGQDVAAGEKIAALIDVDARLAREQAGVERELREAEVAIAIADADAARQRLESPLHLQAALADAESALAKTETEQARLPTLIEAADAQVEFARKNLEGKESAGTAVAGRVIQQARSDHQVAVAQRRELNARGPRLEREQSALLRKKQAVEQQLALLIEEKRQVAETKARVKAANARLRQAELSVQAAQVRLDRMIVHTPRSGRVLSVVGRQGTRVMGLDPGGESKASTVITLYDPKSLQARVDVRLEDIVHVVPGQPVKLESAAASKPIAGHVLTATSQANIQKNTLEVKVALDAPPSALRPEMIVSATFLAPHRPGRFSPESEAPERVYIPRSLVEGSATSANVWVAAHDGTARRRQLTLGSQGPDDLVEVSAGLNPTDRIITEGRQSVSDGDRIAIAGEDAIVRRSSPGTR